MAQKSDICRKVTPGYARWLAWNYDTVQECYGTKFPEGFADRLDEAQELAREKHDGQAMSFNLGGEIFQIWTKGSKGGNRWVLANDDVQIHFRSEKPGWNVSVRYLAAGLWEHSIEYLKEWVSDLLLGEGFEPYNQERGDGNDWARLTRIDFAIDVHSPSFSQEQLPGLLAQNMVLTSGVKAKMIFGSRRNETLQIGMNSKSLQICVYDKGKELIDKPGKEWMYDIWEYGGYSAPYDEEGRRRARDVWRFEIRFGKEFLKDRNLRTFEDFHAKSNIVAAEAIDRRRMISPTLEGEYVGLDYKHRERLDLHPLWATIDALLDTKDKEFVPRGRMITMRREAYIEMLKKQQAGIGRSLSVAQHGGYDEDAAREDALDSVELAMSDQDHDNKIERCMEKQMFIDEAR